MPDSLASEPSGLLAPLHHVRTLAGRLVRNRRSLARDIGLIARNARSLPWIIFPLRSDEEARPEFAPASYQSRWEYLSVVGLVRKIGRASCRERV